MTGEILPLKVNAKDVASGLLLILVAIAGLWLNQDHALGTPRRMGPGYMPMLVFLLQIAIGAAVLLVGLFNGPAPFETCAWRPLISVLAAMSVFALLLERGGLLVAIVATVTVSAFADRSHRPLGVLGLTTFLVVLCWFVFVRQLDIRVKLLPGMMS